MRSSKLFSNLKSTWRSDSRAVGHRERRRERVRSQRRSFTFEQLEDRQMLAANIFSEPLLLQQWNLINTGQQVGNPDFQEIFAVAGEDINVGPAWLAGFTGAGVVIAVVDSGVDTEHPDLVANIHPTLQFDFLDGDNNADPDISDVTNTRGTAVAGIIAAKANGTGTVGVAPDAQIVPVRLFDASTLTTDQNFLDMLNLYQLDIDIFNHSWENDPNAREITQLTVAQEQTLRDSIFSGRNGLGTIHVKSAGNDAGPQFSAGFGNLGNWDSAQYDGFANSRFVIAVTGVDHDGGYNNVDGTVTSHFEAGANILVTAPSGSLRSTNIVDDNGIGSGIYTTDLTGDNGFNRAPINGIEIDRDFLADTAYTSRYNGAEVAAAQVSGVVALMLQANPNLSWRDVQDILVRSARQTADFEIPATGFPLTASKTTWVTNRNEFYREPDAPPVTSPVPLDGLVDTPLADPNDSTGLNLHFAGTPDLFTNGSGFTVSQGRGPYGEALGYGHGVVDAELAVLLAQQWTTKNQHSPDELTYTTGVRQPGSTILASEIGSDDSGRLLVPGQIGGANQAGFIGYYNIFFQDEPDFSSYNGSTSSGSFVSLQVPDTNAMTVEWVEVKLDLTGNANDLDKLRITLVSPDGTYSELNNHFDGRGNTRSQSGIQSEFGVDPPGTIDPPGDANLTFSLSTNRNWGERYDSDPQIDPATGNPYPGGFRQGWELHFENYSASAFGFAGFEVAWHGSEIDAASQRVQGLVGIDENQDTLFNFERWIQTNRDFIGAGFAPDGIANRLREVERIVDTTQESFASNVTVTVRRTGQTEIVDQFITGADGNYYFDLVPDFYTISIDDPSAMVDPNAPSGSLPKYKTEWDITPDYFSAINHARVSPVLSGGFNPATDYDIPIDAAGNPSPFIDPTTGGAVKADLKGINFLLDPGAAAAQATVLTGFIFADLDGNGSFDGSDVLQTGVEVYADLNGNGVHDPATEVLAKSIEDGTYILTVANSNPQLVPLRVLPPAGWTITKPTDPTDPLVDFYTVFGGPGRTASDLDFGLQPPQAQREFSVSGLVFSDLDSSGSLNGLEQGQSGVQVYADLNANGVLDAANEPNTTTLSDGSFSLVVPTFDPITVDIRTIEIADTTVTTPITNAISVTAAPSDVITGLEFGINFPLPPPGSIFGRVFEDKNGDGDQDGDDFGASGFQVFLDLDQSGTFSSGDKTTTSDANGNYFFTDVTPGNIHVRIITAPEFQVTTPGGSLNVAAVASGQTSNSVIFGVNNLEVITDPSTGLPIPLRDFGDLEGYPTLLSENGAWHTVVDGFSLGVRLDREADGQPNAQGNGDDTNGISDEDGIRVVSSIGSPVDIFGQPLKIHVGTNFLEVIVLGIGGNLSGWMDFDGNGDWLGAGEKVFDSVDLLPGRYVLPVFVPMIPDSGGVAARFRWGEANLDFVGGSLFAGEVEDYVLPTSNGTTLVSGNAVPGDFDGSGIVDQGDYNLWKSTFGSSSDLRADGNMNGQIDLADYTVWQDNLGAVASAAASSLAFTTGGSSTNSEFVTERRYPISITATRPDNVPLPALEEIEEPDEVVTASVQVVASTSADLLFSLATPAPTATARPVESTSDQTPSGNNLLALALAEYGIAEEDEEVESLLASEDADAESESGLALAVDAALETVLL